MKSNRFYRQHFHSGDQLVFNLEAGLIGLGVLLILLNIITFQFKGNHYLSVNWMWLCPLLLVSFFCSKKYLNNFPNLALMVKNYSLYFLAFFSFLVLLDGVQYTPFPPIDHFLSFMDQSMRVKETQLIDWTYAHPLLVSTLHLAYHSVVLQWLFMPFILFCINKQQWFNFYLIATLLGFLLGALVYYFFPSVGPAAIFSDVHFNQAQIDRVVNFKEIHHYLMVKTMGGGEMIIFPSFHVLWAVINLYFLRKAPAFLSVPLILINVAAIIGTLFVGELCH